MQNGLQLVQQFKPTHLHIIDNLRAGSHQLRIHAGHAQRGAARQPRHQQRRQDLEAAQPADCDVLVLEALGPAAAATAAAARGAAAAQATPAWGGHRSLRVGKRCRQCGTWCGMLGPLRSSPKDEDEEEGQGGAQANERGPCGTHDHRPPVLGMLWPEGGIWCGMLGQWRGLQCARRFHYEYVLSSGL